MTADRDQATRDGRGKAGMSGEWNKTPLPGGAFRMTKRNRINPITGKPYPADMPDDEVDLYHDSRQVVADARAAVTTDRDQAARDRLAEALIDHLGFVVDHDDCRRVAAALLASGGVVAGLVREGRAEALETAIESLSCWCSLADSYGLSCPRHGDAAEELKDHVAALRATTHLE